MKWKSDNFYINFSLLWVFFWKKKIINLFLSFSRKLNVFGLNIIHKIFIDVLSTIKNKQVFWRIFLYWNIKISGFILKKHKFKYFQKFLIFFFFIVSKWDWFLIIFVNICDRMKTSKITSFGGFCGQQHSKIRFIRW